MKWWLKVIIGRLASCHLLCYNLVDKIRCFSSEVGLIPTFLLTIYYDSEVKIRDEERIFARYNSVVG